MRFAAWTIAPPRKGLPSRAVVSRLLALAGVRINGGWPHLPPCGYVPVKNPDGRGSHVEPHPSRGPLVTRAFELYSSGNYSLRSLAARLARDDLVTKTGHPLPQSNIRL